MRTWRSKRGESLSLLSKGAYFRENTVYSNRAINLFLFFLIYEQVLLLSQFLLLQTAAPDAIVRLQNTSLEKRELVEDIYFKKQHHHSIEEFLIDQLKWCDGKGGLLIQVLFLPLH